MRGLGKRVRSVSSDVLLALPPPQAGLAAQDVTPQVGTYGRCYESHASGLIFFCGARGNKMVK